MAVFSPFAVAVCGVDGVPLPLAVVDLAGHAQLTRFLGENGAGAVVCLA